MSLNYSREEEVEIRRLLKAEPPRPCPRCSAPLDVRGVLPRREVAYVRNRLWVVCTGCRRTLTVDRRALSRKGGDRT